MEENLYWYKAKVMRAVDGDTIEVEVDHGMNIFSREHLRIKDINAPEMSGVKKDSEEYKRGLVVKQRVEQLLSQHPFVMIHTEKDKLTFNRYVADVYYQTGSGWTSLGDTLLTEGLVVKV